METNIQNIYQTIISCLFAKPPEDFKIRRKDNPNVKTCGENHYISPGMKAFISDENTNENLLDKKIIKCTHLQLQFKI
jgi:hypothetical protein